MTAPSIANKPRIPVSVGLLSRRSLLGGAVVLGVALFYILAVPLLNSVVKGDNFFEAGQPYVIFNSYQITPQEGWEVDASELFVTITKSGASLIFTGAVAADQTPEESIQTAIDGFKADQSATWIVGDPTTFVTGAGDHGLTVSGHTAENASATWVVTNGTSNVTVFASSPSGVWATVGPEVEAMVESIVFLDEGASQ